MKWYEAIRQATRLTKLNISAEENQRREFKARTAAFNRFDAQVPGAIHREPDCHGHNGCTYPDPHHHGFGCDQQCSECWGLCHPDCPANKSIKEKK